MRILRRALALGLCLVALPMLKVWAAGEMVGQSRSIVSSLSMPDYVPSTVGESELGRLAADALRIQGAGDIAIVCGGNLRGGLGKGPLTEEAVMAVLPENGPVLRLQLSPAQLWQLLEHGVSASVLNEAEAIDPERSAFDGFPQVSGFSVEYDASQMPGNRLRELRLADGTQLDPLEQNAKLTAIVSERLLQEDLGFSMLWGLESQRLEQGEAELLLAYISSLETVRPEPVPRVRAVGVSTDTIVSRLQVLPFLPVLLIVLVLVSLPLNRRRLRNLDGSHSKEYRDYGDGNYEL